MASILPHTEDFTENSSAIQDLDHVKRTVRDNRGSFDSTRLPAVGNAKVGVKIPAGPQRSCWGEVACF